MACRWTAALEQMCGHPVLAHEVRDPVPPGPDSFGTRCGIHPLQCLELVPEIYQAYPPNAGDPHAGG
ncbi:hypothetical protein [Belnapia sp. F-4-1]|uniref:hypothetical protein n=1 Tax=Belnapia sp. F-4-1 TaxID=1545443 RepID=UPI001186E645|nr:hypothetical protein [Belnapia sp. F-4-1]